MNARFVLTIVSAALTVLVPAAAALADGAFVLHDEDVRLFDGSVGGAECYLPDLDVDGHVLDTSVSAGKATLVSPPNSRDLVMICSGEANNASATQVKIDCLELCVVSNTGLVCADESSCECDYHVTPSGRANVRCHFRG